jgi:hypothetical protein
LCSGYGARLVLCKYLILLYLTLALSTASLIRPTRDFVKEKEFQVQVAHFDVAATIFATIPKQSALISQQLRG